MKFQALLILVLTQAIYAGLPGNGRYSNLAKGLMGFTSLNHLYRPSLDDKASQKTFDGLLNWFDENKIFLTDSDYQILVKRRERLDEEIKAGDLSFIDDLVALIRVRMDEQAVVSRRLRLGGIDFSINEFADIRPTSFPKEASREQRLRKYFKYQALDYREKHPSISLTKAVDYVFQRFQNLLHYFKNVGDEELFEIYMTELLHSWDSHSRFYQEEVFNRTMAQLGREDVGLGATFDYGEESFFKVAQIVAGSQASKVLKVGDIVVGVSATDKVADLIAASELTLEDLYRVVAGEAGQRVRLRVRRAGMEQDALITRAPYKMTEDSITHRVFLKGGLRIGVITVPIFYEDAKGHSCAGDIKQILENSSMQEIDGLIIDVRNNPGGNLSAVIKSVGLFIEKGPVVQMVDLVQTWVGRVQSNQRVYSGPLVVLVNKRSASAAEIFAGSLQEYGRALIVGDEHTVGKATSQYLIRLKEAGFKDASGGIALTVSQVHLPSGNSYEGTGVRSDVVVESYVQSRAKIKTAVAGIPAVFVDKKPLSRSLIYKLKEASLLRQHASPYFQQSRRLVKAFEALKNRSVVSLSHLERQKEGKVISSYCVLESADLDRRNFEEKSPYDSEVLQVTADYIRSGHD